MPQFIVMFFIYVGDMLLEAKTIPNKVTVAYS